MLRMWGGAHHFAARDGGNNYGQEYYVAVVTLFQGIYTEIKAAGYEADGFSADTEKLWLTVARDF